MNRRVVVVGTGAIGSFYGALLAKAGANVTTVCRSDHDCIDRHGFTIRSHNLGTWLFKPSRVLKQVADVSEAADVLLLCTKIIPGLDSASLIRPAVSPNTVIVFIQNGVDTERQMLEAFPDNEVISGLAFICCNRTEPGTIVHSAYGRLTLGSLPASISANTLELCRLFNLGGIECTCSEDIITERWKKCVWNAPFNPLSVLSGGLSTADILRSQEDFVCKIMRDVCRIARAAGHPLPNNIVEANIENTRRMPPYKTSMLLDYENGRPMETEAILGNALRAGMRTGTATPYLESVYAMMKLRELEIARS
ncbi:MAG: ketopantoate reductase family protein [Gammaproteobacteria bacterium]